MTLARRLLDIDLHRRESRFARSFNLAKDKI